MYLLFNIFENGGEGGRRPPQPIRGFVPELNQATNQLFEGDRT